jgi:hypothetical protein
MTVNRLLRRGARRTTNRESKPLPVFPGRPLLDITDTSAVLAMLDDERRAERGLP